MEMCDSSKLKFNLSSVSSKQRGDDNPPRGFISKQSECLGCDGPTVYVSPYMRGDTLVSGYWRHKGEGSGCSPGLINESAEHKRAKEILFGYLKIGMPLKFKGICSQCNAAYVTPTIPMMGVVMEKSRRGEEGKRAVFDIAQVNDNDEAVFGIEVYFKHRTTNEAGRVGIPWVEVNAVDIIEAHTQSTMRQPFTDIRKTSACPNTSECLAERLRLNTLKSEASIASAERCRLAHQRILADEKMRSEAEALRRAAYIEAQGRLEAKRIQDQIEMEAKAISARKEAEEYRLAAVAKAAVERKQRVDRSAEREAKAKAALKIQAAETRAINKEVKMHQRQIDILRSVYIHLNMDTACILGFTSEQRAAEMVRFGYIP